MEAPTFEFGQILFINPTTHVLVVVLLLVLVMAVAMTVGGVIVIAVGIRLNTGIVGQPSFLPVGIEPEPVPGVGVGGVRHAG